MDKANIEQMCAEIFNMTNYSEGAVDVVSLAKSLGFTVGISPLSPKEDGFILIDRHKDTIKRLTNIDTHQIICINSERESGQKRFTLAHEIGHYVLHYLNTSYENIGYFAHRENIQGKNEYENDADYFAACLLMPKDFFIERYNELKNKGLNLEETCLLLSNYFNTPLDSVRRRVGEVLEQA